MQFETLCHAFCLSNFTISFVVVMVVVDNMSSTLTCRKDISFTLLFDRFLFLNEQVTGSCSLIYLSNIHCLSSCLGFVLFLIFICPSCVELIYPP